MLTRSGFKTKEIVPFLAAFGVVLERQPSDHATRDAPRAQEWPEWKLIMARKGALTLHEAAAAFAGVDPAPSWDLSDDEHSEIAKHWTVLEFAIKDGVLATEEDSESEMLIRPRDLIAWCRGNGVSLPLPWPSGATLPTTDAELQESLIKANAEMAVLKAQMADVEMIQRQADSFRERNRALESELLKAQQDIAALRKKAEVVVTAKEVATMQRIIIGLAVGGYRYDPLARRNSAVADIAKDLAVLGLDVTDETVGKHLKKAAALLPSKPA